MAGRCSDSGYTECMGVCGFFLGIFYRVVCSTDKNMLQHYSYRFSYTSANANKQTMSQIHIHGRQITDKNDYIIYMCCVLDDFGQGRQKHF